MNDQDRADVDFSVSCWGVLEVTKPIVLTRSEIFHSLDAWNNVPPSSADGHVGVNIVHPNHDEMLIGLVGDQWMLCRTHIYDRVTYDGQQMWSVGTCSDGPTVAFIWEEWTEMTSRYLIAREAAETAIDYWLRTGELTTSVKWEEILF